MEFSHADCVSSTITSLDTITEVLGKRRGIPESEAFLCAAMGAEQLTDPEFPGTLAAACRRHGGAPAGLCLFFADSLCLSLGLCALDQFLAFKRHGFRLGLDIASLHRLPALFVERLPADVLRLDLLDALVPDGAPDAGADIPDFVAFAANLLMTPAVKGVHSRVQLNMLKDMGIRIGQGPLFSPAAALSPF